MLNHALKQNWIPVSDAKQSVNFNHLMFTDDLLIVILASRSATKVCKLCLEIYKDLTSQMGNMNKSNVYFPSWVNSRVCKAIMEILEIKIGVFPFKYLGCMIGPKRISKNYFQPLVNQTQS